MVADGLSRALGGNACGPCSDSVMGGLCLDYSFRLESATETFRAGEVLGGLLASGDTVVLKGPLGAGKTLFAQGIGRALRVQDRITSPTFAILNEYEGDSLRLYHGDLYRIEGVDEALDIGFDQWIDNGGVTVLEWAERVPDLLPVARIEVLLDYDGVEERTLKAEGFGDRGRRVASSYMELLRRGVQRC